MAAPARSEPLVDEALARGRAVLRLPPASDPFAVVESAAARGPVLVVTPSVSEAVLLHRRVGRTGRTSALLPQEWARAAAGAAVVVGTRGGAWAPVRDLASIVVLDGHDDRHASERAPTWNAWVVSAERASRADVPCVVVSSVPTLELLAWGALVMPSARTGARRVAATAGSRPPSRRPAPGLFSPRLVPTLRSGERVILVLNRKGRATLVACGVCGELVRCRQCDGPMAQDDDGLVCRRCGEHRPVVCLSCASTQVRKLRIGVSRAREELEALAGQPVDEVTGDDDALPSGRLTVGTEAVLHRIDAADVVVFLDVDQELLGPRYRAPESALALLARAARIVGGRHRDGRVVVQTRIPDHPALLAALHADPARLTDALRPQRDALGLPPFRALALLSGDGAADYAAALSASPVVDLRGPADGVWRVTAPDHRTLCDALAAVPRPAARLRVEVDPLRA